MKRIDLLKPLGFAAFLMMFVAVVSAETQKPNFVVIFVDDMGYGDIEPYGSTLSKTPELNRMAAEGMKFTSFLRSGFALFAFQSSFNDRVLS